MSETYLSVVMVISDRGHFQCNTLLEQNIYAVMVQRDLHISGSVIA